jgi:hypothetical protein
VVVQHAVANQLRRGRGAAISGNRLLRGDLHILSDVSKWLNVMMATIKRFLT